MQPYPGFIPTADTPPQFRHSVQRFDNWMRGFKDYVDGLGGGSGDVTAAAVIGDHRLVRGDGGAKGIQGSGITVGDNDAMSGVLSIQLQVGAAVNEFSIDGTLAGNSDVAVPTEKAVKTYVDAADSATLTSAQNYADSLFPVDLAADVTGDLPFANLAQGAALSVLGVTGNATADVASIAAASDHQVLRRSGTAVGFGAVNLAQSAAVTGILPLGNRDAGGANRIPYQDASSGLLTSSSTFVFDGTTLGVGPINISSNNKITFGGGLFGAASAYRFNSSPDVGIRYDAVGYSSGWYGVHDFYTGYNGAASTLAMRIKHGNVGIGTASPTYVLDISAGTTSALHVSGSGGTTVLDIDNTAANGDPILRWLLSGSSSWVMGVDDSASDNLIIGTGSLVTSAPKVTIDTSGNVGIGKTPSYMLDVAGDINANADITGSNGIFGGLLVTGGGGVFGAAATVRGVLTLYHGPGGNTASYITLYSRNGTPRHLWVEDDGTLKLHTSPPVDNADGVVVGAQT